jgi:hydrogenase maturation protease
MPGVLVAGVGNIFLGDDAFGVEVVQELLRREWPDGVRVVDYGIRGLDLAYAILDGCDALILIDAMRRGYAPGTIVVLEPDPDGAGDGVLANAHGMDPARVLRTVREMGGNCPWVRVVGCEPLTFGTEDEPAMGLSEQVRAATGEAIRTVEELVREALARP